MEFQALFNRQESINFSYKQKRKILFRPRGTANKATDSAQEVVPVNDVDIAGSTYSFTEFLSLISSFVSAQGKLLHSFEKEPQVAFKDGTLARFLASSLYLPSLASANKVQTIDAACRSAFNPGVIDFSKKPKVPALDEKTTTGINDFFMNVDQARRVVETEAGEVYSQFRRDLGDYANVINRWYKEANDKQLWSDSAQGWVEGAKRFPSFLSWAVTKIQLLNRPNANLAPDQEAALKVLSSLLSPSGKFVKNNAALRAKAEGLLQEIIERDIVASGALPVWFRIRVLVVFLQEAGNPTYAVRQDPDKRQSKSTQKFVRRMDAVGSADYPEDLDKDVSDYSENSLRGLIDSFQKTVRPQLNEAVGKDLGNMGVSEMLRAKSPVNVFHGMNKRILNNFLLGGVAANNINGSIMKKYDQQKQDEFSAYFAQKFYDNFVDYCSLIGFTGNVERAFKTINVFAFSGKNEAGESKGAYAISVLFPVLVPDVGLVLVNNRSIEMKERAERKQETGFVAKLRSAMQKAGETSGSTADVYIVDQQGNIMSVLNAPWDKVQTTGKTPSGQGGIEGVRDQAHADVVIFGQNKAGNPANLSISLKQENSNYWGGISYERSLTNQSRADRAQGEENWRTSSEVDAFAAGIRQAFLLAENGEKAVSAVLNKVKSSIETSIAKKVPDEELAALIQANYEAFVMFIKGNMGAPSELGKPLIELYSAMQKSQGFIANQLKLEYRMKSFKEFRKPEGSNENAIEAFWALIYDKESIFRKALFGDLADNARVPSGAESASHVIIGDPKIQVNGKDVIITPVGAPAGTVILSNSKFKLHNPVDPTEVKPFGLTQNLEFFKGALPVLLASQSSGQNLGGIQDLYPRIAPIRRLVGKALSPAVSKRIEELYSLGNTSGEISKEQFESQTKKLSDDLAASITSQGKFRIEPSSRLGDITQFVSVYRNKQASEVQLTVDVFLTIGNIPVSQQSAIAEAVIQINRNPSMLFEEVESVVRNVLSEVFAQMPPKGPSVNPAASQGAKPVFDMQGLRKAFQAQITQDLNMIANMIQEKIQAALPDSLASVKFQTKLLPVEVKI